jgi:hypothetical protein
MRNGVQICLLFFFSLKFCLSIGQDTKSTLFTFQRIEKINWKIDTFQFEKTKLWKKSLVPIGIVGISLSLNSIKTKTNIQNSIQKNFNSSDSQLDSYLKYAPIGIMYSADLLKFKSKNSIWNQSKYLFLSELIASGITLGLKHTLKIQRPNQVDHESFPSGHSTVAFTASQVLYNEFHEHNKMIAYSGFLFSIPTATLRVIKNEHWVPDVLMGMGIGIFVTNLVYHFEPLKNWNPWKKTKNIVLFPTINSDYSGFCFSYRM